MFNFKVISVDSEDWNNIVSNSYLYDFYHTAIYHRLDEKGEPLLFNISDNKYSISLPLIIRKIDNTSWKDATSVYGYAGPVSNFRTDDLPEDIIVLFRENLIDYFKKNQIVSVFSRLHPLIAQNEILKDMGEVLDLNKTVTIDLRETEEIQWQQYRKSNKYEINKLKRGDFITSIATNKEDIDKFIDIYYATMDKVNAEPSYYFTRDYFYNFLNNDNFNARLILAKYEGEVVAGAIFTITGKIMQYHLAGTKQEFAKYTPMKLIIDSARLIGNEVNLNFLHLGGGVGGKDDDSLFKFKSGFSNYFTQFKVWKFIVDDDVYNDLSKEHHSQNQIFFPLYRS